MASAVARQTGERTHCVHGHPLSGDNLYIRLDRPEHRECKRCRHLAVKRYQARLPSEQSVRRLIEAAKSGQTIKNVCYGQRGRRKTKVPGLFVMHREQLNTLAVASPPLGERLFRMFHINETSARIEGAKSRRVHPSPSIIRATDDIMEVIAAAVPRYLQRDHRDDVIQNIWLDVLQGRLRRSDIAARTREYIRAEYKMNHNAWGTRSLDVPIYLDGNTTLLDMLTRGLWD
jgi:hypothetical protein